MFRAHFSKGLRNGGVAPCLFCRKNTQGLCVAVLLLAGPLLMPAVLGIGVQGRPVLGNRGAMAYSLYILLCADGTYYTGIAKDVARRLSEHNGLLGNGAKYTAARRPVEIVYEASFPSRSEALKEEMRVKQLTRSQKQELISGVI